MAKKSPVQIDFEAVEAFRADVGRWRDMGMQPSLITRHALGSVPDKMGFPRVSAEFIQYVLLSRVLYHTQEEISHLAGILSGKAYTAGDVKGNRKLYLDSLPLQQRASVCQVSQSVTYLKHLGIPILPLGELPGSHADNRKYFSSYSQRTLCRIALDHVGPDHFDQAWQALLSDILTGLVDIDHRGTAGEEALQLHLLRLAPKKVLQAHPVEESHTIETGLELV